MRALAHFPLVAAVFAQDGGSDGLAKAAAASKEWSSCRFSIVETSEGARRAADPVEGVFEKGKGLHIKEGANNETIYVDGKRAQKRRDGAWRGRANSDPIVPPFAVLEDLEKSFKKLEATDGGRVYSGTLTKAGGVFLLDRLERRIAGQKDARIVGKVTLDDNGHIVKVEITGSCTTESNGAQVAVVVTRTFSFSEINRASLEIPREAQEALDHVQ